MASGHDGDDDELVEIELEELPGEALDPPPAPADRSAQRAHAAQRGRRAAAPGRSRGPTPAPVAAAERGRGRADRHRRGAAADRRRRPRSTRAPIGRCSRREAAAATDPSRRARVAARGRAAGGGGGRSGRCARGGARRVRRGSVARGHAVGAAAPAGAGRALGGAGRRVPAGRGVGPGRRLRARRARRARARTCWWSAAGCWRIACSATPTRSPATRRRSRPSRITWARCSRCCSRARGGRTRWSTATALGGLARRADGARRARARDRRGARLAAAPTTARDGRGAGRPDRRARARRSGAAARDACSASSKR